MALATADRDAACHAAARARRALDDLGATSDRSTKALIDQAW